MKRIVLAIACLNLWSVLSASAANIAFVSFHAGEDQPDSSAAGAGFTNAPDAGYTRLLRENGHTVVRLVTRDNADTDSGFVNALLTNDLIIISRSVLSGHYQQANETAFWNGLNKPVMILGGYVIRGGTGGGSRLGLTTGETMVDTTTSNIWLRAMVPSHPIFQGIALDTNGVMVNPYARRITHTNASTGATILQNGISVNNNALIAGGAQVAVVGTAGDPANNGTIIAEFAQGLTSGNGRSEVLGAKRLVFLTGSREAGGVPANGAGIFDLLPDGQRMFLNAVNYLAGPTGTPPQVTINPPLGTNLYAGESWTFNAMALGSEPLSFQWFKDGQPLSGQNQPSLVIPVLSAEDAGNYMVVVTNLIGRATSAVARLELAVLPPPNLTNALIAYWPLDGVVGGKTPDLVSGYDMTLVNMGTTNLVPGRWGNAFQFQASAQQGLERLHSPGDDLPIYNHPNFTVSLWVNGLPQADRRVFSEGSLTNNNPLFNIGTHNTGASGSADIYIRNDGGATVGNHRISFGTAFDGTWHHIAYVQRQVAPGILRAQLYIDGLLDPVEITPVRPLTAMATSIGMIRRAAASAWFTGLIDEVAVWNRALTPEEIQLLQQTQITNPPSRLMPLTITRFRTDLPAVVRGGTTTLRWEVSRDAAEVEISPLGDVTAETVAGLGSRVLTVTESMALVLTLRRGLDTLSATTRVAVVDGVAPNWVVLDTFDLYQPGLLAPQGYWSDATGNSGQVVATNGHMALRTPGGNSVGFLYLRDWAVSPGQARTLFFRVIAGEPNASGITNVVGLTDKSMRGYGDAFFNIGPVLYFTAFTNEALGVQTNAWYIGARNGWSGNNTSPLPDFAPQPLEAGVVYNLWINITNADETLSAYDLYSVYIQREGQSERTLLFQDYMSDRDPFFVDPVLGGMGPVLDKLVVLGNSASFSAIFDDFYLSSTGYNATVPKPYQFALPAPAVLSVRRVGEQIELRWDRGVLQHAPAVTGPWTDVPGNPNSPWLVTPVEISRYYRTRQ
ncbi:MAG: LamG-like jellyroll fold domain-containing protein [Verrucomicrobiota bacterium]|nr:immunoglobulin domain-containing protein [Limisphaera sp.]MDW8381956.1 LamG-like jellyroll fold domain-containing protein [Verrucomicrobiota bacterium]